MNIHYNLKCLTKGMISISVKQGRKKVSFVVDNDILMLAKEIARRKNMKYTRLLNLWVETGVKAYVKKLREETAKKR